MNRISPFLVILLICLVVVKAKNPCRGELDGWKCDSFSHAVICENQGVNPDESVSCTTINNTCIEGVANMFVGTKDWSIEPMCQQTCDDLIIPSQYWGTAISWCSDIVLQKLGSGSGFPSAVERHSRRWPDHFDHQTEICYNMPTWCEKCCGGAKQQEEYLLEKYSDLNMTSTCRNYLHGMVCSKVFRPCHKEDADYAHDLCVQWATNCKNDAVPNLLNSFHCGQWLVLDYPTSDGGTRWSKSLFFALISCLFYLILL